MKRRLRSLVAAGQLVELRGHLLGLPHTDDTVDDAVSGRFTMHPGGYGFVTPDAAAGPRGESDVFIPPHGIGDAMHGDRVLVDPERRTERGFEGRIVRVLARSWAGTRRTAAGGRTWCRSIRV